MYFILGRVKLRHFETNPKVSLDLDLEFDNSLRQDLHFVKALEPDIHLVYDLDFALDIDLDRVLIRAKTLNRQFNKEVYFGLQRALYRTLESSSKLDGTEELTNRLRQLRDQIPYRLGLGLTLSSASQKEINETQKVWKKCGDSWTKSLEELMINHRNIRHDWNFSDQEKIKLQTYFEANKLLIECLHSDCYVSLTVRKEIEDTLMLPVVETKPEFPALENSATGKSLVNLFDNITTEMTKTTAN